MSMQPPMGTGMPSAMSIDTHISTSVRHRGWGYPGWPLLAAICLTPFITLAYVINLYYVYQNCNAGILCSIAEYKVIRFLVQDCNTGILCSIPGIVQVLIIWAVYGILWIAFRQGVIRLERSVSSNMLASFLRRISEFESVRRLLVSYGGLALLGIVVSIVLNRFTPVAFALAMIVFFVTLYTLFWRPAVRVAQDRNTVQQVSEPVIELEDVSSSPPPLPAPISIALGDKEITIGRQDDNTIVLAHPQVSGIHARLIHDNGIYRILDLGSTYHVYVNGQKITNQILNTNDEIRIGPFKFVFTGTELIQYDESKSVRIDALKLQRFASKGGAISKLWRAIVGKGLHKSPNEVVLLNDISLTIPPGTLVALLGGSGAGKSTLMSALNGFRQADSGTVLYNGEDYYKSLAALRTLIGYVPQYDIVHSDLTVDRALYYAAKMRLPKDFTEQEVMQRIDEVVKEVKMAPHRHKRISKLSGGERKRVSIALELLTKPTIFFLDEPTAGLDPGLDDEFMRILLNLSRNHKHTIVLATHITNDIRYCDYVCFVALGGYLVYSGPREKLVPYFESYFHQKNMSISEIYSKLEPTEQEPHVAKTAAEHFKNSQGSAQGAQVSSLKGRAKLPKVGNRSRQFWLLSRRYLELLKNDGGNLAILILQAPIIGLLLLFFIQAVGRDGFNPNNVLQCPVTASVITSAGYPDSPTPNNPVVSKSCQHVENFLMNDPKGKAYASKKGGTREALQDFIIPGPDYEPTVLFIMAFSAIMFGCINAAREFVKEAPIYRRERAANLGILPYVFSKIAVLGLLCLLQSLILVALVSIYDPFGHSIFLPPFLEVYITIALTSLAGLMMGLAVSALAPNNDRAMSFIPLLLIPQVIFSGTIFPLTIWFLQFASVLFPIRWAMAALGSSVGLHSDKLNGDKLFGNNYAYHGTLFSTYSQVDAMQYLLLTWLALGIMIVAFGIAIGFFLKWKDAW